jgi:hypothetical protein
LIPIPDSTNIAAIGYDAAQEVLAVQFQGGEGKIYRYNGVPESSFVAVITNQDSIGKAFNAHIKERNFPYEQVDAEAVLGI